VFIAGFMEKFEQDDWIAHQGNFLKKLPLNSQECLFIAQYYCAMNEAFKGV